MNKESAAAEIARIYRNHGTHGEWMSMVQLAEHTDMTPAEIGEGMRHLARTEDRFNLVPESNTKVITAMDRAYEVTFGGQAKHLFTWF
jgi:hypothetical protein